MRILILLYVASGLMVVTASSRAIAMGAGAMGTGGLGGLEVSGVSPDTGPSGDRAIDGMGRHMEMGSHMRMTESRAITPADVARGQQIIRIMREELSKYQDYRVAEAAGYLPYMETVPQDVYHFTNRALTGAEWLGDVDLKRPGSLLYERNSLDGYRLVGAMYSAPANYTTEQLDRIVPVSLTAWHQHVNICLPAGITADDVMNGRIAPRVTAASIGAGRHLDPRLGYLGDPRFGFVGTISDEAACAAVGGNFHPLIFGWMVHVYPFAGTDDLKIAFGMDAP